MRHLVGFSLLSSLAAGLLAGCSLSTVGAMDPVEGGSCTTPMQTKQAADGCTECTCDGKTWQCNSDACSATCKAGDTKLAADGCNQCSCGMDGKWNCTTDQTCPPSECQPGDTKFSDDGCATCTCSDSGAWACPAIACVACQPGETKSAGCQDCTCAMDGSGWSCAVSTDGACAPAPQVCKPGDSMESPCKSCVCNDAGSAWTCEGPMDPNCGVPECTPGETTPAGDGCNTCTCTSDGTLACTTKACACPAPATMGGMCPDAKVWAQNPMTKDCCAYDSKCDAPAGWQLFSTSACSTLTPPTMCSGSTADCDADPTNGCETDILSSSSNCGACGVICLSPEGMMGKCDQGKCVYPGPTTCLYGGVTYSLGQSFSSRDGCNTCGCVALPDATPGLLCTTKACQCNPDTETYHRYVETDAMKCAVLDYTCPDNTAMFTNACGCGCEQSSECPDTFTCTPDPATMKTNCDPTLMARCPYSAVAK
jgi:hypothetical protein